MKQYEPAHQTPTLPGQVIGTAVKKEDIKLESEQEERDRYKEILGERKKRKTTPTKENPTQQTTPQPQKYTHAHGHVCSRKDCTPIIVSKRGVIKPNRPSTGHFHISNIPCDRMPNNTTKSVNVNPPDKQQEIEQENEPEKCTHAENEHEKKLTSEIEVPNQDPNHTAKSMNVETELDTNSRLEKEMEHSNTTIAMKSMNVHTATEPLVEQDERDEHDAAARLLLLQQLAEMDLPNTEEDDHPIPLIPLAPNLETEQDPPTQSEPTKPQENTTNTQADKSDSADTVIYDPNEYLSEPAEPPPP